MGLYDLPEHSRYLILRVVRRTHPSCSYFLRDNKTTSSFRRILWHGDSVLPSFLPPNPTKKSLWSSSTSFDPLPAGCSLRRTALWRLRTAICSPDPYPYNSEDDDDGVHNKREEEPATRCSCWKSSTTGSVFDLEYREPRGKVGGHACLLSSLSLPEFRACFCCLCLW